jgi:hypothetical protein
MPLSARGSAEERKFVVAFPIAGTKPILEPSDFLEVRMRCTGVAGTILVLGLLSGCAGHDPSSASSVPLAAASQVSTSSAHERPQGVVTGTADVSLKAIHILGPTVSGAGPVAGRVALTRRGAGLRRHSVPAGGARIRLPAGTYDVVATVRDGDCKPTVATITPGGSRRS